MKNILIVGPSRSGKTTLAKKLNEVTSCFVISLDKLVAVFQGAYPQLDIRLNWDREKTAANLAPFIGQFLGAFSSDTGTVNALNLQAHAVPGNRFVLEGAYFDFEAVASALKLYGIESLKDQFVLVGLVQSQKTADDFFRDFKKYDTEQDWTYGLKDEDLKEISEDAVLYSQSMEDTLAKYGFTLYDTGAARNKVFDQIIEDIIKLD